MSGRSPYATSLEQEILSTLVPSGTTSFGPSVSLDNPVNQRFFKRLLDEHFSPKHGWGNRSGPINPTETKFGEPTQESTLTWGSTVDMSFVQNPAVGPEPTFPIVSSQIVQLVRPHPTTHTTLVVVTLGQGWSGENQTTFTLTYILGVGSAKVVIPKVFTLTAGQLTNASNTVPIVDVNTWPLQSIQIQAAFTLSPANNGPHGVTVGGFVAPVVM